jgi:uncharacterized caspase-like protein
MSLLIVNMEIEEFFTNRKRDDLVLLYFAGHGIKDEHEYFYLATINTCMKNYVSTSIPASLVNNIIYNNLPEQRIILLDCCYSGAYIRDLERHNNKRILKINGNKIKDPIILTSSNLMQYSFETNTGRNGINNSYFTDIVIGGIRTGNADINFDGFIDCKELYHYSNRRMEKISPSQTPQICDKEKKGNNIIIARNPNLISK